MSKPSIYELTLEQLESWLAGYGHKRSRALLVWDWLYKKRAVSFAEMTDVRKECLELLQEHYDIQTLDVHLKQEATDGTIKYLFKLHDGHLIETVLMRNKYGLSICVTTQVGCNIGCSFCASGLLAKKRDLTGGEIVGQIMKVWQEQNQLHRESPAEEQASTEPPVISNVVVMGIGEPLDNFDHLMNALRILKDRKGMSLGAKQITVSTSGLADQIRRFADTGVRVNLALSLHAPNDELRSRIMRINRAYPLKPLMEAIDYYLVQTNRRVTLEYILLRGVNDQEEHARQLAELVGDKQKMLGVNLIPYNPVDEYSSYQRTEREVVLAFYDTLKKYQINCSIRLEHGTDIDAACGQLRSKQMKLAEHPAEAE